MDKYIEILATLLKDWQFLATHFTTYSVVLAALAFVMGGLLVVFLKNKRIAVLSRLLMEDKQALKQAEHKNEELLVKQKTDAESITEFQQQLEQLSKNLQEIKEQHTEFLQKHELLTKTLDEKQSVMETLKLDFDDKSHVVEKLQGKLADQKHLLAEYALDRANIEEMKKEASEASSIKQQLLQRENENNEQIKKIEKLQQSAKNSIDRVLELESQLEKRSYADETEETQGQSAQLDAVKLQLDQEKQNAESKAEYSVELEQKLQQQNQQLAQFNEKLQLLLTQPQPQPVIEEVASSNDDNKVTGGLVGKLLNLVSKLDKVDVSEHHENDKEEELKFEDAWQKHQWIIDQLLEQSTIQTEDNEHQTIVVEKVDSAVKSSDALASDSPKQVNEGQVNEVNEKIQDKLKGFYNKIRS